LANIATVSDYTDFADDTHALGLIMRNYSPILATVDGIGVVAFKAIEFVNIDAKTIDYMVEIQVTSKAPAERTASCCIDLAEADRITLAIDRLMLANVGVTKFTNLQVTFSGKDGFRISVFNQPTGNLVALIELPGTSALLMRAARLEEIKRGIASALDYVRANRA
jgi:hypothetical protein